jgi:formylglycine-generating enzyme required for sulfatase activity
MARKVMLLLFALLFVGCASPAVDAELPLIVDTGVDLESWALVPEGQFLMGQFNHVTMVGHDYEIMVIDVTNQQYARYLNEALGAGVIKVVGDQVVGYYPGDEFHGYRHEEEILAGDWLHVPLDEVGLRLSYAGGTFTAMLGFENHPMVMVTWFGAEAYCGYYGWRLPTEVEWEKAARGTDGRPYPWGDDFESNNANFYSSQDPFEEIVGKQGYTTPVGFYNGSTYNGYQTLDSSSPYGLYDMAGNVEQWTGDVYENQHYRYLRGGSKQSYGFNLRVWTRNNVSPYYSSPSIGFRCVRDVGP